MAGGRRYPAWWVPAGLPPPRLPPRQLTQRLAPSCCHAAPTRLVEPRALVLPSSTHLERVHVGAPQGRLPSCRMEHQVVGVAAGEGQAEGRPNPWGHRTEGRGEGAPRRHGRRHLTAPWTSLRLRVFAPVQSRAAPGACLMASLPSSERASSTEPSADAPRATSSEVQVRAPGRGGPRPSRVPATSSARAAGRCVRVWARSMATWSGVCEWDGSRRALVAAAGRRAGSARLTVPPRLPAARLPTWSPAAPATAGKQAGLDSAGASSARRSLGVGSLERAWSPICKLNRPAEGCRRPASRQLQRWRRHAAAACQTGLTASHSTALAAAPGGQPFRAQPAVRAAPLQQALICSLGGVLKRAAPPAGVQPPVPGSAEPCGLPLPLLSSAARCRAAAASTGAQPASFPPSLADPLPRLHLRASQP